MILDDVRFDQGVVGNARKHIPEKIVQTECVGCVYDSCQCCQEMTASNP